jgi:hypothetical protein
MKSNFTFTKSDEKQRKSRALDQSVTHTVNTSRSSSRVSSFRHLCCYHIREQATHLLFSLILITHILQKAAFYLYNPHPCANYGSHKNAWNWYEQSFLKVNSLCFTILLYFLRGHAVGGAVGWGTVLQAGRSWVRFPMVSLKFFINKILPAALRPWSRLSL